MAQGTVLGQERITFSYGGSGERKDAAAGGAQDEGWDRKHLLKVLVLYQEGELPSVSSPRPVSLSGCFAKGGGPMEAPGRRREHREGCWGFKAVLEGLKERKAGKSTII